MIKNTLMLCGMVALGLLIVIEPSFAKVDLGRAAQQLTQDTGGDSDFQTIVSIAAFIVGILFLLRGNFIVGLAIAVGSLLYLGVFSAAM